MYVEGIINVTGAWFMSRLPYPSGSSFGTNTEFFWMFLTSPDTVSGVQPLSPQEGRKLSLEGRSGGHAGSMLCF